MRISDWSSDVCSSDLLSILTGIVYPSGHSETKGYIVEGVELESAAGPAEAAVQPIAAFMATANPAKGEAQFKKCADRKSVVSGKSVSVRVDLGGRRILKNKKIEP